MYTHLIPPQFGRQLLVARPKQLQNNCKWVVNTFVGRPYWLERTVIASPVSPQVLASNSHTCALFKRVTHSQEELLLDWSGEVRGRIMQAVLQEASTSPQVGVLTPCLLQLDLADLDRPTSDPEVSSKGVAPTAKQADMIL